MNYEVLTSNMPNLDKDWATKKAQSVKVCFKDSIYLHSVLSTSYNLPQGPLVKELHCWCSGTPTFKPAWFQHGY